MKADFHFPMKLFIPAAWCLLPLLPLDSLTGAPPANYQLVWADEFEGSGSPDASKWTFDTGAGGWGNGEAQTYTNSTDNVRQENGMLVIEARQSFGTRVPSYTSGRIKTSGQASWKYAYVEARMKMPSTTGTWSAFWMLPQNSVYGTWPASGEIDIMEHVGYKEDPVYSNLKGGPVPNIHATLHTLERNHQTSSGIGNDVLVAGAASVFHHYAVLWTPEEMVFSVDGMEYHRVVRQDLIPLRNPPADLSPYWPFDQEFFLILNVAIGGNWGGAFNSNWEPASPYGLDGINHDGSWPQSLLVDYVRVYTESPTEMWRGWPVTPERLVDTKSWMGWVYVGAEPWIFSWQTNQWFFPTSILEETFRTDDQWIYFLR